MLPARSHSEALLRRRAARLRGALTETLRAARPPTASSRAAGAAGRTAQSSAALRPSPRPPVPVAPREGAALSRPAAAAPGGRGSGASPGAGGRGSVTVAGRPVAERVAAAEEDEGRRAVVGRAVRIAAPAGKGEGPAAGRCAGLSAGGGGAGPGAAAPRGSGCPRRGAGARSSRRPQTRRALPSARPGYGARGAPGAAQYAPRCSRPPQRPSPWPGPAASLPGPAALPVRLRLRAQIRAALPLRALGV